MQHAKPLLHMVQSKALLYVDAADAIVPDMNIQHIKRAADPYLDLVCFPMANGIGDGFLHDPVNDILLVLVKMFQSGGDLIANFHTGRMLCLFNYPNTVSYTHMTLPTIALV